MSGRLPTERDTRRRELGQNFLVDPQVIDRFVRSLDLRAGELVVDLGAGTGALTLPLLDAGVDQLGGEHCSDRLVRLVKAGHVTETRLDESAGRLLRDAKLYEIGAGTSEIRRMLIGRELFNETA